MLDSKKRKLKNVTMELNDNSNENANNGDEAVVRKRARSDDVTGVPKESQVSNGSGGKMVNKSMQTFKVLKMLGWQGEAGISYLVGLISIRTNSLEFLKETRLGRGG